MTTKFWAKFALFCLSLTCFLSFLPACAPEYTDTPDFRMQLIREMKEFEQQFGLHETSNFKQYSPQQQSYDYYFYAPIFELPYSSGDSLLGFGHGKSENVTLDRSKYDFFFYEVPAVASVGTDVTKSLMDSPLWRFIEVVFHEDWHEQVNPPLSLSEPSAEVMGYALALRFTGQKFGENSGVHRDLQYNLSVKIRESAVYTEYYAKLSDLYAAYRAGSFNESETRTRKDLILNDMGHILKDIYGVKPDQLNNAFIAFQMTYLRHFPIMYRLYQATGGDIAKTADILKGMPGQNQNPPNIEAIKQIENQAVKYFQENFTRLGAPATGVKTAPERVFLPSFHLPVPA